jgi:hypothetical protein
MVTGCCWLSWSSTKWPDRLQLRRHAVDVEHARLDLEPVAGKADDALDVVRLVVRGQLEDGDVAAPRQPLEHAPREQVQPERERVAAVAVGELRDEQVVADQQRRLHRARGYVERLEREGAHDQRDARAYARVRTVSLAPPALRSVVITRGSRILSP